MLVLTSTTKNTERGGDFEMCTGDEIEIAIFLVKQASLIHTTNVMFNHIHMYA